MNTLKDKCAIVGIGETEYSKDSGRSELSLVIDASMKAIDDAGLKPEDIDGMVRFVVDPTTEEEGHRIPRHPRAHLLRRACLHGYGCRGPCSPRLHGGGHRDGHQCPALPGHEREVWEAVWVWGDNRASGAGAGGVHGAFRAPGTGPTAGNGTPDATCTSTARQARSSGQYRSHAGSTPT